MRVRGCLLFALLAGCAAERQASGEVDSSLGWEPSDDDDLGPIYLMVSDEREGEASRLHVIDVGEPGGAGEAAVVLETNEDIAVSALSLSRRWASIVVGGRSVHLIDFVASPLDGARAVEPPVAGHFYETWFAADDSALVGLFEPVGPAPTVLYYLPLLESGPLVPIAVAMPDDRSPWSKAGIDEEGRWLAFLAYREQDDSAGLYLSEIVDGQPTPAILIHEQIPLEWLGDRLHVAGAAVLFETREQVFDTDEPVRHSLHRIDLETLELWTLAESVPEPVRWVASADGSRVLYQRGPEEEQFVDYFEIVDGEPQPAMTLSFGGGGPAWVKSADFTSPDGRYALAKLQGELAWFDFDAPAPSQPKGVGDGSLMSDQQGAWAASLTTDGFIQLLNPSLGLSELVDLPPDWRARQVAVHAANTRVEIDAHEGPVDGIWTLRTTDEPGPFVQFAHPLDWGQELPLWGNATFVPTSERHFYQVVEAEGRTIWENDGLGVRTPLLEVEGSEVLLEVVVPGL